jgi:hypothetical protein
MGACCRTPQALQVVEWLPHLPERDLPYRGVLSGPHLQGYLDIVCHDPARGAGEDFNANFSKPQQESDSRNRGKSLHAGRQWNHCVIAFARASPCPCRIRLLSLRGRQ